MRCGLYTDAGGTRGCARDLNHAGEHRTEGWLKPTTAAPPTVEEAVKTFDVDTIFDVDTTFDAKAYCGFVDGKNSSWEAKCYNCLKPPDRAVDGVLMCDPCAGVVK